MLDIQPLRRTSVFGTQCYQRILIVLYSAHSSYKVSMLHSRTIKTRAQQPCRRLSVLLSWCNGSSRGAFWVVPRQRCFYIRHVVSKSSEPSQDIVSARLQRCCTKDSVVQSITTALLWCCSLCRRLDRNRTSVFLILMVRPKFCCVRHVKFVCEFRDLRGISQCLSIKLFCLWLTLSPFKCAIWRSAHWSLTGYDIVQEIRHEMHSRCLELFCLLEGYIDDEQVLWSTLWQHELTIRIAFAVIQSCALI